MNLKFKVIIATAVLLFSMVTVFMPNSTKASPYPAWDFEDHSFDHPFFTTLSTSQMIIEFQKMDALFEAHGLPAPRHFAYPNDDYNEQVINMVSQHRLSGRTAGTGPSNPVYPLGDRWFNLASGCITSTTTYEQVKGWIDEAISRKSLTCIVTHDVYSLPTSNGVTPIILSQVIDYLIVKQGLGQLSVMTMKQAYTDYNGDKAVVVMSFDDGWESDYTIVWPLFKARGLAGTSYIVGSIPDSGISRTLNWNMIWEMAQVSPPTTFGWNLTVNVNDELKGTVNRTGTFNVTSGMLPLSATPAEGFVFDHWEFDSNNNYSTSNPLLLSAQTPGTSHNITAIFDLPKKVPTSWNVTVSVNGLVGGTTNPAGFVDVDLSLNGLTVTAFPSANYAFNYWKFDGNTQSSNPISIPKQEAGTSHTLIAFFRDVPVAVPEPPSLANWTVSISKNCEGGTVDPSGFLSVNTPLTVSATSSSDYNFSYWLLDGTKITTNPITVPEQNPISFHTLIAFFNFTSTSPNPSAAPISPSPVPSATPMPLPTATPTPTASPSPTPIPTSTETSTPSPTQMPTQSEMPASAPSPTVSPFSVSMPSLTPTPTLPAPSTTSLETANPTSTPPQTTMPQATSTLLVDSEASSNSPATLNLFNAVVGIGGLLTVVVVSAISANSELKKRKH